MTKKAVYLFGAGAAIPWNAPNTSDLTTLVLNSGFYCKNGTKRVTQKIVETLSNYFPIEEINFETILNVIEELLVFHSSRDYKNTNSFLFPFLESRCFLDEIFNYEMNGDWQHGSSLIIKGFELESGKSSFSNQSPQQFYLQLLYANVLTVISARVSSYSYHTTEVTKVVTENNRELNNNFYNWINSEVGNNSTVRFYTLNYDRLFSVLLKKRGINIFEGAECESELTPEEILPFDVKKIATDFTSNIHYNLHGSSFWDVRNRNHHQLPSIQYFLTGAPNLSSNLWEQPLAQMEKGKIINPSNIITGYQKTQKTSMSPFRQMQSAFDRDCLEANKLIIIGYSFGDAHLNETIRMAIIHNPNIDIEVIDPNFRKNKLDEKIGLELLSNSEISLSPTNLSENSCSFLNGKVKVNEYYFDEYLNQFKAI
jgi:hypothetical protein